MEAAGAVHTLDPEKSPETERLTPSADGREQPQKKAGHASHVINRVY